MKTIKQTIIDYLYAAGVNGCSFTELQEVYHDEQVKRHHCPPTGWGRRNAYEHIPMNLTRILKGCGMKQGPACSRAPWVHLAFAKAPGVWTPPLGIEAQLQLASDEELHRELEVRQQRRNAALMNRLKALAEVVDALRPGHDLRDCCDRDTDSLLPWNGGCVRCFFLRLKSGHTLTPPPNVTLELDVEFWTETK